LRLEPRRALEDALGAVAPPGLPEPGSTPEKRAGLSGRGERRIAGVVVLVKEAVGAHLDRRVPAEHLCPCERLAGFALVARPEIPETRVELDDTVPRVGA